MNNIIKFCEDNLPNAEFKYAKLYFKNASSDALNILKRLCRRNKDNMIMVLRLITALERIKSSKQNRKKWAKIEKDYMEKFIKAYTDAANFFIILHPERGKQLRRKFKKFFLNITQPSAYDPLKSGFTYNIMLKELVTALKDEYPLHTENSILNGLSELLNELGCKSLQNKPFTRQILHSLINS